MSLSTSALTAGGGYLTRVPSWYAGKSRHTRTCLYLKGQVTEQNACLLSSIPGGFCYGGRRACGTGGMQATAGTRVHLYTRCDSFAAATTARYISACLPPTYLPPPPKHLTAGSAVYRIPTRLATASGSYQRTLAPGTCATNNHTSAPRRGDIKGRLCCRHLAPPLTFLFLTPTPLLC